MKKDKFEYRHIEGYCEQCGKACESITIDEGIGCYEYWGQKGTDHRYVEVSPCCEAEVLRN